MNIFIAEIQRLLNKPSVRSAMLEKEPIALQLIDREFENTEGVILPKDKKEENIARVVRIEEHFFNTLPEGKLILEAAEKYLNHMPLFPDEKTEEKMALVEVPSYSPWREIYREIFSSTGVTKSDAQKIVNILETARNQGRMR